MKYQKYLYGCATNCTGNYCSRPARLNSYELNIATQKIKLFIDCIKKCLISLIGALKEIKWLCYAKRHDKLDGWLKVIQRVEVETKNDNAI